LVGDELTVNVRQSRMAHGLYHQACDDLVARDDFHRPRIQGAKRLGMAGVLKFGHNEGRFFRRLFLECRTEGHQGLHGA